MRWKKRPEGSNWGDFGPDDQLGKLNLLTPERRLEGVREVREGLTFALSLPLDYPGGGGLVSRKPPQIQSAVRNVDDFSYNYQYSGVDPRRTDISCDDVLTLWTQYSTQWDSLAHWGSEFDADDDGVDEIVYYNGYRGGEHIVGPGQEGGPAALALGLENAAETGVQGRAVLVDLYSTYGEELTLVDYDGLMRAIEDRNVDVRPGDFLCIYTGWADMVLGMKKQPDPQKLTNSHAVLDGRDKRLLQWISDSGIVAIVADNLGVECINYPAETMPQGRYSGLPLHEHCIFKQGIILGELWQLGDLARWLRKHTRSSFLLTAPPLRMPGLVGSPVTGVATV
ncbi:cyclase family protein [Microbacterium sp.]|uniref:cyclase family protein n=1 Tax=Microbacterium sp. TaxID=51671 RepID=UPI003C1E620F